MYVRVRRWNVRAKKINEVSNKLVGHFFIHVHCILIGLATYIMCPA